MTRLGSPKGKGKNTASDVSEAVFYARRRSVSRVLS